MATLNNVFPIPTGGAVGISFTTSPSGVVVLSRAVSGSGGLGAFTPLYSGAPLSLVGEACFYLDIGDLTPGPLLSGTQYVYQLTDVGGTQQSQPVTTASSVDIEQTPFTQIVIALLQGAINTARDGNTLPNGIKWARVMAAMPLAGNFPLPAIFVVPETLVQEAVPIGQDDEKIGDLIQPAKLNIWTMTEQDRHMFRLTVMSLSPEERDYYRDFVIAMLRVSVAYAFSQFGADVIHEFMAESYQEVDQTNQMVPGFYAADVLYQFVGTGNVKVTTSYQTISTITTTITGAPDQYVEIITGSWSTTVSGSGQPIVDVTQVPHL